MSEPIREPAAAKALSLLESFSLGLKVWGREMRRLSQTALLRFEQGRLEKRLAQEYERLGKLAAASRGGTVDAVDWDASLKQIDFLQEEIATLAREALARRQGEAAPGTVERPEPRPE